jgi:hypothetical protein
MSEFLRRLAATNPVLLAGGVRAVLLALVGLGWLALDDTAIATVVTAVAAVCELLSTLLVRATVYSPATVDDLMSEKP